MEHGSPVTPTHGEAELGLTSLMGGHGESCRLTTQWQKTSRVGGEGMLKKRRWAGPSSCRGLEDKGSEGLRALGDEYEVSERLSV